MASLHRIFQVPPGFEDDSPEACRLDRAIAEDRADALIRQAQATSKGSDALEHLIQLVTFERCSRSLVVTDFLRSLRHQGRFDLSLMFDLDEATSSAMLSVLDALRWQSVRLESLTDRVDERIDSAVIEHRLLG
jgi:hypothetical protein